MNGASARRASGIVALSAALQLACTGGIDAPSAYSTQRYLCDEAHATDLAEIVGDCRETKQCWGAMSLQGTLQEEPVTIEASLEQTEFENVETGAGEVLRDSITLIGQTPYFLFEWNFREVGGDVESAEPLHLEVTRLAVSQDSGVRDDRVRTLMRLTGGSGSVAMIGDHGTVVTRAHGLGEQSAEVEIDFGAAGSATGCFHAIGQHFRTRSIP